MADKHHCVHCKKEVYLPPYEIEECAKTSLKMKIYCEVCHEEALDYIGCTKIPDWVDDYYNSDLSSCFPVYATRLENLQEKVDQITDAIGEAHV